MRFLAADGGNEERNNFAIGWVLFREIQPFNSQSPFGSGKGSASFVEGGLRICGPLSFSRTLFSIPQRDLFLTIYLKSIACSIAYALLKHCLGICTNPIPLRLCPSLRPFLESRDMPVNLIPIMDLVPVFHFFKESRLPHERGKKRADSLASRTPPFNRRLNLQGRVADQFTGVSMVFTAVAP